MIEQAGGKRKSRKSLPHGALGRVGNSRNKELLEDGANASQGRNTRRKISITGKATLMCGHTYNVEG